MPYFNKSNLPHWNKTGHDGSVASTFGLASNSPIVLIAGQIPDASSGKPGYNFYLCNLIASWVPSSFGVDPRVSDALQSSLSNSDIMQNLYHNSTPEDVTNMRFSRQWFQALNPTWDERNRTNITVLWRLVQTFSSKENLNGTNQATMSFIERHDGVANYTAAEIFLAKVFGVYLTEGLARSTYQYQATRLVLNETEDYQLTYINLNEQYGVRGGIHKLTTLNSTFYREDWWGQTIDHEGSLAEFRRKQDAYLRLNIVAERHGYGSGQERRTLQWAQATIGIYLGILAVYASWVGVMAVLDLFRSESSRERTRALSVIPWSDLQDLIILALRTPVPNDGDLSDAGAGVSSTRVWDKTVKVGLDGNFKAQLVLDEGHDARLEGHPQMR
jgi:hypothetical protein